MTRRGTAIVVGGGVTGLLAARMLTEHFEEVTLLERDRFTAGPAARKGVPQAHHPHVLLVRGRAILEQAFPGVTEELVRHGAVWFDYAQDGRLRLGGYQLPRFRSGVATLSCSRALLEWCVRRRVAAHPRIRLLQGARATELIADAGQAEVLGVRVRCGDGGEERALHADLVVDASGRGSRAPDWLGKIGYGRPQETVITPFLGYATQVYQLPGGRPIGWTVAGLATECPGNPRGAAMMRVEDGRLMVTLVGTAKHYPPTTQPEFLEFARHVLDPVLYDTIGRAEPLSPIRGYRGTENRLRHFERLTRWPERFVVVGDAVCSFNPIYAQGMTVGAVGVLALDRCLRRCRRPRGDLTGMAERFQKQLARLYRLPWMMATVEDLRWPTTTGGRPGWQTKLTGWYMSRLFALMAESPSTTRTFLQVMHMIAPPLAVFRPGILVKVLWRAAASQWRAPSSAPARWLRTSLPEEV
jgi:2-polyprenyl-6-methoxyphenol hydroxylase-like FAD-dependent oxidoreductase